MPSIIHTTSKLAEARGIALVSQSVSEQVNGLIAVACEFVCRASNVAFVDSLFYPDAPPPIWPNSVNPQTLLSGKLFMAKRSVSQSNGLVAVQAEYAGGLVRDREYIFHRQETSGPVTFNFVSEPFSLSFQDPNNPDTITTAGNLVSVIRYTFLPIIHFYDYVSIGGEVTGVAPALGVAPLFELVSFESSIPVSGGNNLRYISYDREYFIRAINGREKAKDFKTSYITPSVVEVTERHFIL